MRWRARPSSASRLFVEVETGSRYYAIVDPVSRFGIVVARLPTRNSFVLDASIGLALTPSELRGEFAGARPLAQTISCVR